MCEAFVRKYLMVRKNDVCMQIRRWVDEADQILRVNKETPNPYQDQQPQTPTAESLGHQQADLPSQVAGSEVQRSSKMIQYTWSQFF
mmetsp:Transcript_14449/g.24661  ORF Transcript_14449/g.24661 Transcript_14449/m.24661 type:complete len:87 (+) Transcript_14449:432-692(+)